MHSFPDDQGQLSARSGVNSPSWSCVLSEWVTQSWGGMAKARVLGRLQDLLRAAIRGCISGHSAGLGDVLSLSQGGSPGICPFFNVESPC